MATITRLAQTEADLQAQPRDGNKYELVDGEIQVSPGGFRHGRVGLELGARLREHVRAARLGVVLGSDMGYRLPGGNVRSPDVSFVTSDRVPAPDQQDDYMDGVPDLAVEIISPGDRVRRVHDRVGEYLEAGVRLVWVIDPKRGTAVIYRGLDSVHTIGSEGVLDGADVLPGFSCPLAALFD